METRPAATQAAAAALRAVDPPTTPACCQRVCSSPVAGTVGGVGHSPPRVGLGSASSTFGDVLGSPCNSPSFLSAPSPLGGTTASFLRFAAAPVSNRGGCAKQRLGLSTSIGEAGTLNWWSSSFMRDASAALRTW